MSASETVRGELGAKIDEYLTRVTPFGFSGAFLVAEKEKVLLNKGYGMAIRERGILNTADTVFCIGSITKQFTAAAIMRLWMQSKLDIGDCIDKYFDDVPEDKRAITLHNLLTHTAGLVDSIGDDYDVISREEYVQKALSCPLRSKIGTAYEYSNVGFSLLAAIVEIGAGEPYEEFLHEQLFETLGVACTGYRIPNWSKRVVADWYAGEVNNGNSLAKAFPYWNVIGNGGILSTTEDMLKWCLALKSEKVLSQKAKEKMFTPFLDNYAYGWNVSETDNGKLIGHDGGNDLGASADLRWFVDHDIVTILFCNQTYIGTGLATQIRGQMLKLVFGGDVDVPAVVTENPDLNVKSFVGTYCLDLSDCFLISFQNGLMFLEARGRDAISIIFPFWQEQNADTEKLNRRTLEIYREILKGDYHHFENELEDKSTFDRKRRFLESVLRKPELGALSKIEVVGTFPFPRKENGLESVVRLTFGKRTLLSGVIWHGGKIWGIPMEPYQPVMPLKPISETKFAGYHLGLAKGVIIDFTLDNKDVARALIVSSATRRLVARRV